MANKRRGSETNPYRADARRLESENTRLKRQLERVEAIIDAQKKLAALLDSPIEEKQS